MSSEQSQLEAAVAALETQRALLGDAMVESLLAPARARLAILFEAKRAAETEQTLKQVSILFLDVVGSTLLSQHLDPEAISVVLDGALARGTAIVEAHRGKVLQYAGDNLLAAFGVDESREDESECAVRCGLALLELGRALGGEVEAAHGHAGFDVRIGIHTGPVLLGGGVAADGTIRGIAVNIAARMEQTAPAGGLRISHDTYAQVRGLFEVAVQEPLDVRGVDEPVQSYLVLRAKPKSFRIGTRGIEGVATRMIGRDAELEILQDAYKRVFEERKLAAITVTADAGIGKSRLLYEFAAWSEARPESFFVFRGRASPQTQGQPFGLLRDILAWRFQIADDDTVEAAREKMERGIVPLFERDDGPDLAEGHAHLLGHLIGIEWRESRHVKGILDDPKQIRNRAFHAAAQLFRRVGATKDRPIILQLEDLHWADNETLDFLGYLTEIVRDVPLLVMAFSRPTLFERRANWCAENVHRRIDLSPLDKAHSRYLADELLKKLPEVPAALRELVTGGSEGNPFYMEELVKMLIDQGAITVGEAWKVNAERLLLTKVPSTLTGVLQARLDGLPAAERLTLQEASVIGPVFWDRALIALDENAAASLPSLVSRELALPRTDATNDDLREYAFKHAILHQVTYATVLKRTKKELHGKLARWLSSQTGLRANDFLGVAAGHFEEAGDDANAAEFHARASEQANTRMAHEAVMKHVQRAFALIATTPEASTRSLRWRLLVVRESTLDILAKRPEQRADIEALEVLAGDLEDIRRRAYAAWRRSYLAMRTTDYRATEAAARLAMKWATQAEDASLRLLSQRMLALALVHRGDHAAGKVLAEDALTEGRALGLRDVEGHCLNTLALIANIQGDVVAQLDLMRQALVANQAGGSARGEAVARTNLGAGWLNLGEVVEGRRETEEGLRLVRANGDRAMECGPLCNLSSLALWQGDDARALSLARSAVETAIAVQAPNWEVIALCRLGDAELALGRHAASAQAFALARERAVEIRSPQEYDALAGLAQVALARDALPDALDAIGTLLDLDDAGGANAGLLDSAEAPRRIELACHRVLARADDPRAEAWLNKAHDALHTQAARITEARLREGFLANIPEHREIEAAWDAATDPVIEHARSAEA